MRGMRSLIKSNVTKRTLSKESSFFKMLQEGSYAVRLSALVFGFGCFRNGQFLKGMILFLFECVTGGFLGSQGFNHIYRLGSLGETQRKKIWNQGINMYEYIEGDNSLDILFHGIISIAVVLFFLCLLKLSVRCAFHAEKMKREGKTPETFIDDVKMYFNQKLHVTMLSLPTIGVITCTVIPLIFIICIAFTDYSIEGNHTILFHWVGLKNFQQVLNFSSSLSKTFYSVLLWTMVWAIVASLSNYILGSCLAFFIHWKEIRAKKFWKACFIVTIMIPHFVSLLSIGQFLQPEGTLNVLCRNLGIIGANDSIPFFTDATWARVTVIIINLWVGIPYTLLHVNEVLDDMPSEFADVAKIEGVSTLQYLLKIRIPYVTVMTRPYLITALVGNINNFNVIYLTSQGYPMNVGETAGKTDLLITWIYKLTIHNQYFNIGATVGILTFIMLAISSIASTALYRYHVNKEGIL